jgi:hypothetical protein
MDTLMAVEGFVLFLMSFWKRVTCLNQRRKARGLKMKYITNETYSIPKLPHCFARSRSEFLHGRLRPRYVLDLRGRCPLQHLEASEFRKERCTLPGIARLDCDVVCER